MGNDAPEESRQRNVVKGMKGQVLVIKGQSRWERTLHGSRHSSFFGALALADASGYSHKRIGKLRVGDQRFVGEGLQEGHQSRFLFAGELESGRDIIARPF